jgi:hypothetical protein
LKPKEIVMPVMCKFVPMGDGRWIMQPVELADHHTVDLRKAAALLKISHNGVRRLIELGYLITERPTPHTTRVILKSLLEHKERTRDQEFWTKNKFGG